MRLGAGGRNRVLAALLDPAVPRADVLADVAAVHLGSELAAVLLGNRARRLRPVREAARRVERARLVERSRGAGLDAERARAAVELERRGALDLRVRDERPEHDPGPVTPRDQHRVLAVEADARADGAFAVDVVVLVDEHAVLAAEPAAERVELLAELRVRVEPRVAGQPALARLQVGLRRVVAERGGDHCARVREQCLRVAGDLGAGHREPHVGEEPALLALRDVALSRLVGLGRGRADDVDAELGRDPLQLPRCHE